MVAGFYGSRRSAIELPGGVNDSSCHEKVDYSCFSALCSGDGAGFLRERFRRLILSELLGQRRPSTTKQHQRTLTSVERPTEGQGLRPAFAIALGCVLAVVVNLLGTRYESARV